MKQLLRDQAENACLFVCLYDRLCGSINNYAKVAQTGGSLIQHDDTFLPFRREKPGGLSADADQAEARELTNKTSELSGALAEASVPGLHHSDDLLSEGKWRPTTAWLPGEHQ